MDLREEIQREFRGSSVNDCILNAIDGDYDEILVIGIKDDTVYTSVSTDSMLTIYGAMEVVKNLYLNDDDS